MDRTQSPSKLLTLQSEAEAESPKTKDYYSSDASLTSVKQAVLSETEAESPKTIVMPVMRISTNNWEDGCHEGHVRKAH